MYKIGDKVRVSQYNDNENYHSFRDETLVVTYAEVGGLGYDNSVYPEQLMCFETLGGEEIPYSLYEYEVEPV